MKYIFGLILLVFSLSSCKKSNAFEINKENVYQVKCHNVESESYGSATAVFKDGLLVTNFHVISYGISDSYSIYENIELKGYYDNEYIKAELVDFDYSNDLALLKINREFKHVKTSNDVFELDEVYAIGNLNNNGICVTKGCISNSNLSMEYLGLVNKFYQVDITVSNGNSGGGLYNLDGALIGIITFRLRDSYQEVIQGISYVIPIERCINIFESNL